jgi:hypothetical protein
MSNKDSLHNKHTRGLGFGIPYNNVAQPFIYEGHLLTFVLAVLHFCWSFYLLITNSYIFVGLNAIFYFYLQIWIVQKN